ncbi:MAG: acyl-CoA thioesterase [Spirochaetales bacterium]|jgi:acyl-CoA thioester hydrolase|nr:acyl-CoA thioesterase [Spirochaetales bacterium]
MRHICKLGVRSYECDGYNHVNNAVYLNYLEYARMEFLKDTGFDYAKFVSMGYAVIVARVAIDYKLSAVLYDELTIETVPVKRRATSGVFHQRILRGESLVAEADVTWATLSPQGKPCPMPPEFNSQAFNPES